MKRRFGAHHTTSGGIIYAAIAARALGGEAIQLMLGEGHSWSPYKMPENTLNEFRKLTYGMGVYVHLPYTLNPCIGRSSSQYGMQRSVMRKYLELSDAVGATAVVLHPGYKKELSDKAARDNFILFMDSLSDLSLNTRILLETDSGSKNGSKIGSLEFIRYVLYSLGRTRYGMCIDTEHLWARGLNLWDDQIRADFIEEYHEFIELVHLNPPDPGVGLGSNVDRHSTPFSDFDLPSESMIKDFVLNYPAVLERKSLGVIEADYAYVSSLVPSVPESIELALTGDGEINGNERTDD